MNRPGLASPPKRNDGRSAGIPSPSAPNSAAETGLDRQFLLRFVLKSAYVTNLETPTAIADYVRLPEGVVEEVLEAAKEQRLVEVLGLVDPRRSIYRYALTAAGREWAIEALRQCRYTGPAPVTLDAYRAQVAAHPTAAVPRVGLVQAYLASGERARAMAEIAELRRLDGALAAQVTAGVVP